MQKSMSLRKLDRELDKLGGIPGDADSVAVTMWALAPDETNDVIVEPICHEMAFNKGVCSDEFMSIPLL